MLVRVEGASLEVLWMVNCIFHDLHAILDFLSQDVMHVEAGNQFGNQKEEAIALEFDGLREFIDQKSNGNNLNHDANEHSLEHRGRFHFIKINFLEIFSWELLLPIIHSCWIQQRDKGKIEDTVINLVLNRFLIFLFWFPFFTRVLNESNLLTLI